jgi:hypothetical protein
LVTDGEVDGRVVDDRCSAYCTERDVVPVRCCPSYRAFGVEDADVAGDFRRWQFQRGIAPAALIRGGTVPMVRSSTGGLPGRAWLVAARPVSQIVPAAGLLHVQ